MGKRSDGARTAGIVIAAALLCVCILLAVVFTSIRGGTRDSITLPDAAAAVEPDLEPAPSNTGFVSVDRENVQAVLDTMLRPEGYHQVLTVTNFWEGGSASRTVEIWRSGSLARARIAESDRTRNLLTNGETVWIWYQGERTARAMQPDASVSFDDLTGVPTYETLAERLPDDIVEAGFVTLDEPDDLSCLYISVRDGIYEDHYWVDVRTQILCRADALAGTEQTYQLRQVSCEVAAAGDASLEGVFQLPDGTAVAVIEE